MHNVLNVEINGADGKTPAREFRVSTSRRYKVTDWERYNGGSVAVVADNLTLAQANRIASDLGRANPGALVNTMEHPDEGGHVMVTEPAAMNVAMTLGSDGSLPVAVALGTLPHDVVRRIRLAAAWTGDRVLVAHLDEAQVAMDAETMADCEGLADLADGRTVSHERVAAWIASLDTPDPQGRPEPHPRIWLAREEAVRIRANLAAFNLSTADLDAAIARTVVTAP